MPRYDLYPDTVVTKCELMRRKPGAGWRQKSNLSSNLNLFKDCKKRGEPARSRMRTKIRFIRSAISFSKCEKFIGGNATLEPSHYRKNAKNSGGFGGVGPSITSLAWLYIISHLETKFASLSPNCGRACKNKDSICFSTGPAPMG